MTERKAPYDTKGQTIFRVKKSKDNPFVMMDKRPIENDSLSWKAKGLLSYLLSRPDDWTIRIGDLVKRSTDGDYSTRGAIKELMEAGHLIRKQGRTDGAKFDTVTYDVYEEPLRDNPQAENPQAENRALNKIDSTKKDLNDNLSTTTPAEKPLEKSKPKKKTPPKKKKQPKEKKPVGFVGKFAEYKTYADVFSELTGLIPTKWQHVIMWSYGSEKSGARGFRDFIEAGITVDDMKTAILQYKKSSSGYPIANPNTIFSRASNVSLKNRRKNVKKSIIERNAGFGQEVIEHQEAVRRGAIR